MCMISCTYFKHTLYYHPCIFDKEALTIKGNFNGHIDSIYSNDWYISRVIMDLMNVKFTDSYRVDRKDIHKTKVLSYKILQCEDTTWAKKMILDELSKKYPYEIIDTIERHKVYDMTFLDTTFFYPRVYDDPMLIGFAYYPAYILRYNREYPTILMEPIYNAEENKGVEVNIGKVIPEEMRFNRYNIFLHREFTDLPVYLPRYFEYLREEMCVDAILSEDYTIPIKLIRLK